MPEDFLRLRFQNSYNTISTVVLLIKASHKAKPDTKSKETEFTSFDGKNCKTRWPVQG